MATYSRETTHHEAGHAILAHLLGLEVCEIRVNADNSGAVDTSCAGHLSFIEQAALCLAGMEAQHICDCQSPSGRGDNEQFLKLAARLPADCRETIRSAAWECASDHLLPLKSLIEHVAQKLIERGKLTGAEFRQLIGAG